MASALNISRSTFPPSSAMWAPSSGILRIWDAWWTANSPTRVQAQPQPQVWALAHPSAGVTCNVYLRGAERIEPRKQRQKNVWRFLAFIFFLMFIALGGFTYTLMKKTNTTLV